MDVLDEIMVLMDEMFDEGVIVSLDTNTLMARTYMKDIDGANYNVQEQKE